MNKVLKFANYIVAKEKRFKEFLESYLQKNIDSKIREFQLKHKQDPTDTEIKQWKKDIVMSKGVLFFLFLLLVFVLLQAGLKLLYQWLVH